MRPSALVWTLAVVLAVRPAPVAAQAPSAEAFRGGVPAGTATAEVLSLTLDEAITRGLQHNLGLILGRERVREAQGARREARADLLPQARAGAYALRESVSLAALGFSGLPGLPVLPEIIGPFNVVDARGYLSQTVFDLHSIRHARAAALDAKAAEHQQRRTRDDVVFACADLYLEAVAGESRIASARAQLTTAQALYDLASDRKKSGLVAGIDVLRAQVQLAAQRQRVIVAEDEAAKQKLALARAIGLPLGQALRLADEMPFAALPPVAPEEALPRAYAARADLHAAEARVRAAEQERRAAAGEGLPSVGVSGDYGAIGSDVSGARPTFTVSVNLRVPIFEGGRVQAKVQQADARLQQARAGLDDLRAGVYYEIQSTLLDLKAAEERVGVATSALELAEQQLEQAQDRFAAGVAGNIDVTQAQEALARAAEDRIQSIFEHNVSKASLARALGAAESSYGDFLRGGGR
jgi:outer membrane protein TolC